MANMAVSGKSNGVAYAPRVCLNIWKRESKRAKYIHTQWSVTATNDWRPEKLRRWRKKAHRREKTTESPWERVVMIKWTNERMERNSQRIHQSKWNIHKVFIRPIVISFEDSLARAISLSPILISDYYWTFF